MHVLRENWPSFEGERYPTPASRGPPTSWRAGFSRPAARPRKQARPASAWSVKSDSATQGVHRLFSIAEGGSHRYRTVGFQEARIGVLPATGARSIDRVPMHDVAVVYSGRWYSTRLPPAWAENHLSHLIRPNNASVYVTVGALNWCDVRDGTGQVASARRSI